MVNIEELAKEARMKDYEKLKGYDEVEIDQIDVESNCQSSANSKNRATVTRTKSFETLKASKKKKSDGLRATQAETQSKPETKSKPEVKSKPSLKKTKTVDATQSCEDGTKKKTKGKKKAKKVSNETVKKEDEKEEEGKMELPPAKATPTTLRSEVTSVATLPTPTVPTPMDESNSYVTSRHSSHVDAPKQSTRRSHHKRARKRQEKECCCSIL